MSKLRSRVVKPLALAAMGIPSVERLYVAYFKRWRLPGLTERSREVLSKFDRKPPAVGDIAPDFTLKGLVDGRPVTLTDFLGKRPVVLIFGSYT